jgi:hypothetical protein
MIVPGFLRIGNILTLCYEDELKPYTVEILQADLVHLSSRPEADDPRDIIGLPVTRAFLLNNNFEELNQQFIACYNKKLIKIEFSAETDDAWVYVDKVEFTVRYIHELQNLLFYTAGWEITSSFKNLLQS